MLLFYSNINILKINCKYTTFFGESISYKELSF